MMLSMLNNGLIDRVSYHVVGILGCSSAIHPVTQVMCKSVICISFCSTVYKSHENPYQQVPGTTSHMRSFERAMKSKICMIKSLSP